MASSPARSYYEEFFQNLSATCQRLLLLDYDGTIAPFTRHRDCAFPYPQVSEILDEIMALGTTRVVIITGRPVAEMPALLRLQNVPELFGCHGLERLSVDGTFHRSELSPAQHSALFNIRASLQAEGLAPLIESKPGGIAIHWRGLAPEEIAAARSSAYNILDARQCPGFEILPFDGGVEVRIAGIHKGEVIRVLQKECGPATAMAYLGDDLTDEDAFRALDSRGLAVLVREEFRSTAAQVWLRPPDELVGFLSMWLDASGGRQC